MTFKIWRFDGRVGAGMKGSMYPRSSTVSFTPLPRFFCVAWTRCATGWYGGNNTATNSKIDICVSLSGGCDKRFMKVRYHLHLTMKQKQPFLNKSNFKVMEE